MKKRIKKRDIVELDRGVRNLHLQLPKDLADEAKVLIKSNGYDFGAYILLAIRDLMSEIVDSGNVPHPGGK